MPFEILHRPISPVITVVVAGLAIATGLLYFVVQEDPSVNEGHVLIDRVAKGMNFEMPLTEPHEPLMDLALLPAEVTEILELRRAFFSGDFRHVDKALNDHRVDYLNSREGSIPYPRFLAALYSTIMAGIDRCDDWLELMPESYVAHWVCADIWTSGALDARGSRYSHSVSPDQFAIMRERLTVSNQLLERAVGLTEKPVEALTRLAQNHKLLKSGLSDHYFEKAEQVFPRYLPLHRIRTMFLQPKWGGSDQLVKLSIEKARRAGVSEPDLLDMEDEFLIKPGKLSAPGATRAYWENAIAEAPTLKRRIGLMHDYANLKNWKALVDEATSLIEQHPDAADAYYWLAQAHKMLGNMDDARAAFVTAAAMGHNIAVQELIMAHVRGGLGVGGEGQGIPSLPQLCHYSAALGSSVGANCLGASYFEGVDPDNPFPHNPAQGFAWHLLAARAGHYNSQHDLGWMLYSGRVPGMNSAEAHDLGVFWLRRAAEKNHRFAKRRLEELGIAPSEKVETHYIGSNIAQQLARMRAQIEALFRKLLSIIG